MTVRPQSTISEKNMESKFTYQLMHRAEMDLEDIVSYISIELSNSQAATAFVDKLLISIEEIKRFPESGICVDNEFVQNRAVRKKLIGNYIMYYLPDLKTKTIYVLRIVYGRRNIDEILRSLR